MGSKRRRRAKLAKLGASKKAKIVRRASDFNVSRLTAALRHPDSHTTAHSWQIADIRDARDQQMLGQFERPAALARAMRTDDALFTAYDNRLAPQRSIDVEIKAAVGARGAAIASEAEPLFGKDAQGFEPGALSDIHGCLANHGVAIGYNRLVPREDGSRVDLVHRYWPIEHVRWDEARRCLVTMVDEVPPEMIGDVGYTHEMPIRHGDGRWTVYQQHQHEPWTQQATILSAALVWARHAHGIRDWAKGSGAHGNAKVIGTMPKGFAIADSNNNLTDEGRDFMALLQQVASPDAAVGIKIPGSELEYLTNNSTAWQVWAELVLNAQKAAARIYLGTDGTLGAAGGAPGVDIATLFGVATTKVQGDLECISRGINTGVIPIWAALNFGDSRLAPKRNYLMPDVDKEATLKSFAQRQEWLFRDIETMAERFVVTQSVVNELAERYDVPAPQLQNERPALDLLPAAAE